MSCRRGPAEQRAEPAASATAPAASISPAATTSATSSARAAASARPARSAPAPVPSGSAPITPEEQAVARRFLDALSRGRVATRKKNYPDAISAFDEALKANPFHPRALSERGFARLQSGDLEGAERDLYAALGGSPEPAVLSAATFNLALIAERRGQAELATQLRDAARANRVSRPPPGACSSEISPNSFSTSETLKLQTLRQVRTELKKHAASRNVAESLPTSDEEAILLQDMLGGGEGPWKIGLGEETHLLFGKPTDYTLIKSAAAEHGFRCGMLFVLSVDMTGNPMIILGGSNSPVGMHCSKSDPAASDVDVNCSTFCGEPRYAIRDVNVYERQTGRLLVSFSMQSVNMYDPPTGKQLAAAEREADRLSGAVFLRKDDGVQILWGECNKVVPFVR
jgi:hypothetical protein